MLATCATWPASSTSTRPGPTGPGPCRRSCARRSGPASTSSLLTDHDNLRRARGRPGGLARRRAPARRRGGHAARATTTWPSAPSGHTRKGGRTPAEVCQAVEDAGGFGFAAHPFSEGSKLFRRRGIPFEDLDCVTGIELWSFVNDTGEAVKRYRDVVRFLTLAEPVHRPPARAQPAQRGTSCASARRVVAIGGLDAHQVGIRIGRWVPLRLMSYRRSFRHIRTHVLIDGEPTQRERLRRAARGPLLHRDGLARAGERVLVRARRRHAARARAARRAAAAPARRRGGRDRLGARARPRGRTNRASTAPRRTCTRTAASAPGS